jgi:hypothetical protein
MMNLEAIELVEADSKEESDAGTREKMADPVAKYRESAELAAMNAAFQALPFVGKDPLDYWNPPAMPERTHEAEKKAFLTGVSYARMFAEHARKWPNHAFMIAIIIEELHRAAAKHPKKGSGLRAGFMHAMADFIGHAIQSTRDPQTKGLAA